MTRLTSLRSRPGRPRARRFRALGAAGAVLTLVATLTSCSGPNDTSVMSVDGVKTSKKALESDLQSVAAAVLKGTTGEERAAAQKNFHGADKDAKTWSADYTAQMLNRRLVDQVIEQEYKAAKLPTPVLSAETRAQVTQSFGSEAVYKALPADYRARTEASAASFDGLVAAAKKKLGDPKDYFAKHKSEFGSEVCASHILVKTEDEAKSIKKDLDAGGDFAAIAKAKSTDTGSGAQGGELGCTSPDSYVPPFAAATKTLPIGKLSDPVQSEFGFHLIKVSKRTEATYESSKEKIDAAIAQAANNAVSESLVKRLKGAKIVVAPAYGVVVPNPQNGLPQIQSKKAAAASKAAASAADATAGAGAGSAANGG